MSNTKDQAPCLINLAQLLLEDDQPEPAGEAIIRSINLVEEGPEFFPCQSHRVLDRIFRSKRGREKAIQHCNLAIGIASISNRHDQPFWIHYSLAILFRDEGEFDNAHTHIKQAKQHALDDKYYLGRATEMLARIWHWQGGMMMGVLDVLCAIEIYEKLGAAGDLDNCGEPLYDIRQAMKESSVFGVSNSSGEFLQTDSLPTPADYSSADEMSISPSALMNTRQGNGYVRPPTYIPGLPLIYIPTLSNPQPLTRICFVFPSVVNYPHIPGPVKSPMILLSTCPSRHSNGFICLQVLASITFEKSISVPIRCTTSQPPGPQVNCSRVGSSRFGGLIRLALRLLLRSTNKHLPLSWLCQTTGKRRCIPM